MASTTKTDDLVSVYIPKKAKGDTERFVAVNGENMLIQTGKTVMVPRKFAEVIDNSMRRDEIAQQFIESLTN